MKLENGKFFYSGVLSGPVDLPIGFATDIDFRTLKAPTGYEWVKVTEKEYPAEKDKRVNWVCREISRPKYIILKFISYRSNSVAWVNCVMLDVNKLNSEEIELRRMYTAYSNQLQFQKEQ